MEENDMDDFGKFSGSLTVNGESIAYTVCQEVITKYRHQQPSIRFLVKGQHSHQGPFAFFLKQDDDSSWISQYCPKFLSTQFIEKLAFLIEHHTI